MVDMNPTVSVINLYVNDLTKTKRECWNEWVRKKLLKYIIYKKKKTHINNMDEYNETDEGASCFKQKVK